MPERTTRPQREDAAEDIGWSLGVLLRGYRESVAPRLDDLPQGPRGYETLCAVVRGDHPSQLALANHLGIDRTVMTYLIDDLVEAGLVERRANPVDRRQRMVVATRAGEDLIAAKCSEISEVEADLLRGLKPAERRQFRDLLDKAALAAGGEQP